MLCGQKKKKLNEVGLCVRAYNQSQIGSHPSRFKSMNCLEFKTQSHQG